MNPARTRLRARAVSAFMPVLGACAMLALSACGPRSGEVLNQYRPAITAHASEMRRALENIAAQSAGTGTATTPASASASAATPPAPAGAATTAATPPAATGPGASALTPRPVYRQEEGRYNMEFVPKARVTDPAAKVELDLFLGDPGLIRALLWLQEDPTGSDTSKAGESFIEGLKTAAGLRYVLIYDSGTYTRPKATSATQYTGGVLHMQCHLVDLTTQQPVLHFRVQAAVPPTMKYEYKKGQEDPAERLEAWVSSAIWEEARRQIAEQLRTLAGADIVVR